MTFISFYSLPIYQYQSIDINFINLVITHTPIQINCISLCSHSYTVYDL